MSRNQHENLYETDFHAWTFEQARRLRAGEPIDVEHVAEEIEDMGRSQQQQLESRLAVLLQHMLKCAYQPKKRTRSWELTIAEQRRQANRLLMQNPSLKAKLVDTIREAYVTAVILASTETRIVEEDFPAKCPYTADEILGLREQPDKRPRKTSLARRAPSKTKPKSH